MSKFIVNGLFLCYTLQQLKKICGICKGTLFANDEAAEIAHMWSKRELL